MTLLDTIEEVEIPPYVWVISKQQNTTYLFSVESHHNSKSHVGLKLLGEQNDIERGEHSVSSLRPANIELQREPLSQNTVEVRSPSERKACDSADAKHDKKNFVSL